MTASPWSQPSLGARLLASSATMPNRVRPAHVEWVATRLSERDWQIIHAVNHLRIISGPHLQTLFFSSLASHRSQAVSRSRVLRRLVGWRVLVPLERRIGGAAGRGSNAQAFALDSCGQRLIAQQQQADGEPLRVRRPGSPGDRTLKHTLAVTTLYVSLVELSRQRGFIVEEFAAEPGCWWPNGLGGHVKPDAYARLALGGVVEHTWIEHDEATESLPTIRSKLLTYLDFLKRGQLGPNATQPRVLVSTVSERRRDAVAGLVSRLPPPATELFAVVKSEHAAEHLFEVLRE